MDPALHARFLEYAQDVVRTFAGDSESSWDVWNEPEHVSTSSGAAEPAGRLQRDGRAATVFEWSARGPDATVDERPVEGRLVRTG